ncbi:MAG: hypothetical protein ABSH38_02310 [Verrucomicrobiota bacterium]|jgi:hypothetical protein
MKLNLEVRNNPLVVLFTVYVDGLGTLQQASFQHSKPGVFTYSQDITVPGPTLFIKYTIVGVGSNIQSPTGVCLVSFGVPPAAPPAAPTPNYLKPYLIAAITAGNSADSEEFSYPVAGGASALSQIPGFDQL